MYTKYTGIILKKYPLSEADELLTIYTKESGKLRVLVRGVRKIKSRLAGSLESLNEVEFETASGRRASLPVLISVRANAINDYLREDLKKFAYALVGIETLYRMTADGQENQEIYQSLLKFLNDLGSTSDENLVVRLFQLELLACCGYKFPHQETALRKGLSGELEQELDQFLDYILEREIKSKKFLQNVK